MTRKLKRLIFNSLIIAVAFFSIQYVLSYDQRVGEAMDEHEQIDRDIFLEAYEFSVLCSVGTNIYAGGSDGLYKIDTLSGGIAEILDGEKRLEIVRGLKYQDGILYVGYDDGIVLFEEGRVIKRYTKADGLPDQRITDLKLYENKIYVATFGGIGIIEDGIVTSIREEDGLFKNNSKVVMIDSNKNLWCGSYASIGGGVTLFEDGEIRYFSTKNGLSHNAITTIVEDSEGNVWVGGGNMTEGGGILFKEEAGEWVIKRSLTVESGLIGEKVRHIFIDDKDNKWFCSESNGIAIEKENGDWLYLTKDNGLSDNEVKQMTLDEEGNLWLASRRGVTRINKTWLETSINKQE